MKGARDEAREKSVMGRWSRARLKPKALAARTLTLLAAESSCGHSFGRSSGLLFADQNAVDCGPSRSG